MSSDLMRGIKTVTRPPKASTVRLADFLALQAIVQTMAALNAMQFEQGGGEAQGWLNAVAEAASNAMSRSAISGLSEEDAEDLRQKAIESMRQILSGIILPKGAAREN